MSKRPASLQAFAAETAQTLDGRIERMAATANAIANETNDPRWNRLALALRAARRLARELMAGDGATRRGRAS